MVQLGTIRRGVASLGVIGILGLAPATAAAQSLEEALESTYRSNPTVEAARAELRSTFENVPQALSGWRPQAQITTSYGKERRIDQAPIEDTSVATPFDARLSVVQPLYQGGITTAATERAENEVRAAKANLQDTEQQVLLDAVTAYLDVWRDQSVLELNINNEQVLQRQLEATGDRFEVGEVTRTDVAQSESRLATAAANRIAAAGNLSQSRAVFRRITGLEPVVLEEPPVVSGLPATLDDTIELAVRNSPSVLSGIYTELAADKQVREIEGELLPFINLRGDLIHSEETSGPNIEGNSARILAELTIPLYQGGQVYSRVRQAKQVANQRRMQVGEARRLARQQAIQAWENLETARAQIESFESSVRSAEIALDGVRQENLVGARTVLDVLDAEQELLNSQVNLVVAVRDRIVAGYQVLASTGQLTAESLGLDVPYYNTQDDYYAVRDRWFGTDIPSNDSSFEGVKD